jgi:hypothetical protein
MNPRGHDYEIMAKDYHSTSLTAGTGSLVKSMLGRVFVAGRLEHTGPTIISEGTLQVNGDITGPVELRARGTLSGIVGLKDTIIFEGALNQEGCRLMPGYDDEEYIEGVIVSEKSMVLPGNVCLEVTAGMICTTNADCTPSCGSLYVKGDLTFRNANFINVNLLHVGEVSYVIAECTGTLTCDVAKLKMRGLEGVNYDVVVEDGKRLVLKIHKTRAPQADVTWTGSESRVWDYKAMNFKTTDATSFVAGDAVVFNDKAEQKNVTVNDMVVTSGVTFDS